MKKIRILWRYREDKNTSFMEGYVEESNDDFLYISPISTWQSGAWYKRDEIEYWVMGEK